MSFELWVLFVGAVLFAMGVAAPYVQRLPFTATLVYLLLGCVMGPLGFGFLNLSPIDQLDFFHRSAEVTVVISLFAVGAKLRLPVLDRRWIAPMTLAVLSMTLTVALIAWVATRFMGLPLGAGVLLGAILAPTDPVLASDVQVKHPHDRDALRLTLSGEAGLNDGTAFPFVMLGLGLLGLHDLGEGMSRWWTKDVAWSVFGGLAIGGALGLATGKIATALRAKRANVVFWDEYLLLGLIALSYGIAVTAGTYGFLSVFAAGVSVRAIERIAMEDAPRGDRGADNAPPVEMARALLGFNEQIERILEVGMVILVGSALFVVGVSPACLWFVRCFFWCCGHSQSSPCVSCFRSRVASSRASHGSASAASARSTTFPMRCPTAWPTNSPEPSHRSPSPSSPRRSWYTVSPSPSFPPLTRRHPIEPRRPNHNRTAAARSAGGVLG